MKLFFKLFISLSIPFGAGMGALIGFDRGLEQGLIWGSFEGVFFGVMMSLILGALHWRNSRKWGADDIEPYQEASVEVMAPSLDSVFERSLRAVKDFGARIEKSDAKMGTIRARVRSSWKSWGETLTLNIQNTGDAKFEIRIASAPRVRWIIVDYGKGRENIEDLSRRLISR